MNEIKLASGRGQFHSDGGNNPKPLRSITLSDIERMMTKPQQCDKSESEWFIPCDALTRSKEKQRASNGLFYALWGDVDDMQGVTLQALADQVTAELSDFMGDVRLMAYTTKSATETNQKSRLILPVETPLSIDDFIRCQTVLNNKLEALGVIPDHATQRPAQICYLPNKGAFYQTVNNGSQPFDPITFWRDELAKLDEQQQQAEKDRQQRLEQSRIKASQRVASGTHSPIEAFNTSYDLDSLLIGYGYMRTGKSRYLSPNSSSGIAGLEVKDGRYITAHQSDISAGLRQSGDAFDLFVFHEHNGNYSQAVKAAGAMFTTSDGVTLTKANQRAYMTAQAQTATLLSFDALLSNTPIKAPIAVDADGVISEIETDNAPVVASFETFEATGLVIATDHKGIKWRLMETHCRDHLHSVESADDLAKLLDDADPRCLVVMLTENKAPYAGMESNQLRIASVDHNELLNRGNGAFIKQLLTSIKPYFADCPIRNSPNFWDVRRNKEGDVTAIMETLKNFKALLAWEGVTLRYKTIGREIEWRDSYDCKGDTADADRLTKLISAAKKYSLPVTLITDYLSTVASENSFNPVEAFIMRQPWDQQTDYIEQLLNTLTIAKGFDISLARVYLRKWLVSAVMLATAQRPQEAHGVLILQSDNHGAGKGRWFKRLVEAIDPDLLGTGGLDVRDKDSILKIGKKWVYELSEIEASMSRREIGELKAFITSATDEVRAPYARTAQKLPRRTAFCGSANAKTFLTDPTGSRRFWVIPVERVDYQHKLNMQQLWAQAYSLYQSGESWWLSHDEIQAVTDANNAHFQQLCPISEALAGAFKWESDQREWTNYLSAGEALAVLFGSDYRPNQKDVNTAAAYLRNRCGDAVQKKVGGSNNRRYKMPDRVSPFG